MGTRHGIGSVKLCGFGGTEVNEKTTRPRTISPGNIHSFHLYQDTIELIARTQALDVPLYRKTINRTPASTILPLLRLLTKSHLPTTPAKAIRIRNQPIRTDLTKPDIPSYTNSRQNSAQDLDHRVTRWMEVRIKPVMRPTYPSQLIFSS